MDELLSTVKAYLHIDWTEDDDLLKGYIARGEAYLNRTAGKDLNFTGEALPRQLLLDYCRYANSQALEVFSHNFQSELLDLYLENQEVPDEDTDTH